MAEKLTEQEMEDLKWLMTFWEDAESKWNPDKANELRRAIKAAFKYIEENYPDIKNIEMDNVIEEFNVRNARFLSSRIISAANLYEQDALEDFIREPNIFWDLFDKAKNKAKFLTEPTEFYGTNRQKNLRLFARRYFNNFFCVKGKKMSVEEISQYTPEQRKSIIDHIVSVSKRRTRAEIQNDGKEEMIASLQNTIKELNAFGTLEDDRIRYNELMTRVNLESLVISSAGKEGITLDMLFSKETLSKLSYFQLENMHCFYSNRLAKVEERIGLGLFLISTILKSDSRGAKSYDLSDEELKTKWQEYCIFHRIFEEKREEFDEVCSVITDANGTENLRSYSNDDVYENFLQRYEKIFKILFGNTQDIKKDCDIFCSTTGLTQINNYMLKDLVLGDIIIQCSRQKINWGYIEDEEKPGLSKLPLIGVDVPGLSMPLRLHIPIDKLKRIVKEYLNVDEIPVYIGKEDFRDSFGNIGTPLIVPIASKQSDAIKREAKKEEKKPNKASLVQHIACTQLPNPIQKLLKWKTGGKKKHADYINVDDGKIFSVETPISI